MKINDKICGFSVRDAVTNEELGGTLWKLRHDKTGAELVWLDNGEENKLFSIAFKTLPWDDTGVFHILEHSVLCGSEKYPVKEPFLDLLKGSMNTFLNAMTFPDKTMYPVSSRNEQDFLNLTSVYLDAVFCPAIYKNPGIFMQEGWHYELHGDETVPTYKGVVFNEMKGSYSSVETVAWNEMKALLFPDSCYRHSSGGDPKAIPDLSYEDFLGAHRECYHPSNSKTYLDGNLPIERVLGLIDSYFDRFERNESKHDIPLQAPVAAKVSVKDYAIGKDEDEKNKVQMSLGKLLCDWSDKKKIFALNILSMYLCDSNAAPLKRAVLEDELAQDVWLSVNDGTAQCYSIIRVRNTEYENRDKIKANIKKMAEELLQKGLDREELEANINQLEFRLKETEEPRGVERAISSMSAWLYGGEAEEYLIFNDTVEELRAALDTDYFESLLREMLLDEAHTSELYLLPSKTENDKVREAEEKRLQAAAATWNEEDRAEILRKTAELEAWQASEDTPEALATLPILALSDIGEMPPKTPIEVLEENGVKCLFHKIPTNGVVHAKLYFNIADAALDDLPMVSFLAALLGDLPTEHYSLLELNRQVKKYIGNLNFGVAPYAVAGHPERCRLFFTASISVLEHNLSAAAELVTEILKHTRFDDTGAIRELLLQICQRLNQSIINRGNSYAALRANRSFGAAFAADEKLSGYDKFRALSDFANDFEGRIENFCSFAKDFCENSFVSARMTLSETCDAPHAEIAALTDCFEKGTAAPDCMEPALSGESMKEAIRIPAGISYAALGSNLVRHGVDYTGKLAVLSNILSLGYLWTEIRVKGGAYGCGFNANTFGKLSFSSFRDPTPLRSLEIYRNTADFIKGFVESEESVDKYIISTVSSAAPLLSASQKGAASDASYWSEISYEDKCTRREQMLSMKKQDLLSLCPLFEDMAEKGSVCIVAHDGVVSSLDDSWTVYSV